MRYLNALALAGLLASAAAAATTPVHDVWAERFMVGAFADPARFEHADGVPAGIFAVPVVDTVWTAGARRALADPDGALARFLGTAPDTGRARAWLVATSRAVAEIERGVGSHVAAAEPFAAARLTLAFFTALDHGDTARALDLATALAEPAVYGLEPGVRLVWSLRASLLAGRRGWPELEPRLAGQGPWDRSNAWTLAVALRRCHGLPVFGPEADDGTALTLSGVSRLGLTAADLAASPFGADARSGLGAIGLPAGALPAHFALYPDAPASRVWQGAWSRGQRRLVRGDPAAYEQLARRSDLAPRWQMDLWRRASERRLLAGDWTDGRENLARALHLAAQPTLPAPPSRRVREWSEQAFALATALGRGGDAGAILDLAQQQAAVVKDPRYRASVALMRDRRGRAPLPPPEADQVARSRRRVRLGDAAGLAVADAPDRANLTAGAATPPWQLWRRWGLALSDTANLPTERRRAAAAYHAALDTAAGPADLLRAAQGRLAPRGDLLAGLWRHSLDREARAAAGWATPPAPSPLPALVREVRGSRADLHALLGCALALGDMRGTLACAAVLPGTGLERDDKRRFLYPLPASGPILEALLAADNEPALLLAIARNESLFEPAVRSRAGALGWMQIMPFHYPELGARPGPGHWSNPAQSIGRGDGLVSENRRRYGDDPYRVLAAYNAGPAAVRRWDEQLGGAADRQLFLLWIGYTETRNYVEKVLIDRDIYDWILSGAPGE